MQMVQELAEDDPDHRIQFSEQMINLIDNIQMSLASKVFFRRQYLHLTYMEKVNRHNWAVIVIGWTNRWIEIRGQIE
jgi:hypothetical protein